MVLVDPELIGAVEESGGKSVLRKHLVGAQRRAGRRKDREAHHVGSGRGFRIEMVEVGPGRLAAENDMPEVVDVVPMLLFTVREFGGIEEMRQPLVLEIRYPADGLLQRS